MNGDIYIWACDIKDRKQKKKKIKKIRIIFLFDFQMFIS